MNEAPLLKVENLSVTLGDNPILKDVSFELERERVLAIIGPNGAGKSVLLKTLLGIIKPTSGKITWAPNIRIGYLPQRFHVDLYLPMTVGEFLDLKPTREMTNEEALALVEIEVSWLNRKLAHLSGGQLQRVLLAWSLLDNPQILLFDEPTENVDVVGQESIYALLHHLQDSTGVSLIIISHDLHAVYRYANNVLCINQTTVCFGEPEAELTVDKLSSLYKDQTFFHHDYGSLDGHTHANHSHEHHEHAKPK